MIYTILGLTLLLQSTGKGTIDGIVVNATTGEAIAGAQVTLFEAPLGSAGAGITGGVLFGMTASSIGAPPPSPPAPPRVTEQSRPAAPAMTTTSADGRFSFKDVNAASYRIMVVANGYARQEYGQRAINTQGRSFQLAAGENLRDLSIRLTPTGVVSGRISDDTGQPAVDVPVQLLRLAYNPQGKALQPAGAAIANDRGEYRLYGITPGSYYLNVGNGPGPTRRPLQPGGFAPGPPGPVGAIYAMSFYPGVSAVEQASLIEVKSGAEVVADMRVKRQQMYRVRGRVMDSRTGQPPARVSVSLSYRNLNGGGGSFSSGQGYDPATGAFELQNVMP
jgi:hypothetical protein